MYQLELSADSSRKRGVESEGQNVETAEQTAGTAEQGVGTAAAQSIHLALQSRTGCSRWGEAQARHTLELSGASGLPLLLSELLALVLQANVTIN
jgi:hypothetical protein